MIMTSLQQQCQYVDLRETKQLRDLKGIDKSYQNEIFVEVEILCQKLWIFMSNFGLFYHNHSPNMVKSCDSC